MNKRKSKLLCTLLFGALLTGKPELAAAESEFSLDEYVVTASRIPVKLSETAASVTVVNRDDIEKGNFTSVPEILKQTNVMIMENLGGVGDSSILINGDYRVIVLVDGRRINTDSRSYASLCGINLDVLPSVKNIERIEVVRGPASSLYGSDAVGGVINIITRKAKQENTTFSTDIGSWGIRRYSLTTENKVNDISYLITAERKRQDSFDYKDARTGDVRTMPNSYLAQDTLNLRLDKEFSGGRSLSLAFDHTNSRQGYYFMVPGMPHHYPTASKADLVNNVALTYYWQQGGGADNLFRIYRNYTSNTIEKFMEGSPFESTRFTTNGVTGAEWQQNWRLSDRHTLVGGADWRQSHVEIPGDNVDATVSNKAVFLEDRWKLTDAWTLSTGVRYDHHSSFGGKNTGRLTLNRELNKHSNMYLSWGQVFRAPLPENLFGSSGMGYVGNPNLRPETGDTVTLGMNTRLKGGTNLQASVFSSRLKDAFVWNTTSFPWFMDNIAEEKKQGGEISLTHRLSSQWEVSAGYSYVRIQKKDQGEVSFYDDPDNSQPHGYRLDVRYNQDNWDAGLSLRGATGRDLRAFTSDAYWVVDLTAKYRFNPDTQAYVKVYNLTNRAYELTGSYNLGAHIPGGYPMAARYFVFGVERRM